MRRSEAHQGVRMIKFLDILGRYEAAALGQFEAAALLGVGERTFRRWRQRYEEEGEVGLLDRRLGKVSGKRVPSDRGGGRGALQDPLRRVHGEALSRTSDAPSWVHVGLHLDQDLPACAGPAREGPAARGAPPQTATPALAGDDAASGRLAARLAGWPAGA